MNIICKKRKDIKLFFMGIGHPSMNCDTTVAEECVERSKTYDLYDKNIFFNDWVEYSQRQNYVTESEVGVSTHYIIKYLSGFRYVIESFLIKSILKIKIVIFL
ncbi:hypothetical protein AC231_18170 [Clostridium pasteurianum]|uniref:hypothetical protein n=1 Tax=Clostridium pasteurianum TaxID=1501 RepID=UPI0009763894|nr:hypothetical protein [Clostridium pasteurianum]OMH19899.1 hypothetical protein AC231_18170 [Clostridium pasteurianum]